LNDRGRVGLGPSIGSAAKSVEGLLQNPADSAYSLKVVSVGYLNGQMNQWGGEPLVVPKDFVGTTKSRQYSRSRTILTVGAIAVGAVLLIVTRSLIGSGSPSNDGGGGGGGQQS
jgi:hypothetical protein